LQLLVERKRRELHSRQKENAARERR